MPAQVDFLPSPSVLAIFFSYFMLHALIFPGYLQNFEYWFIYVAVWNRCGTSDITARWNEPRELWVRGLPKFKDDRRRARVEWGSLLTLYSWEIPISSWKRMPFWWWIICGLLPLRVDSECPFPKLSGFCEVDICWSAVCRGSPISGCWSDISKPLEHKGDVQGHW